MSPTSLTPNPYESPRTIGSQREKHKRHAAGLRVRSQIWLIGLLGLGLAGAVGIMIPAFHWPGLAIVGFASAVILIAIVAKTLRVRQLPGMNLRHTTMVELLVAWAIVGVLISLTLPAKSSTGRQRRPLLNYAPPPLSLPLSSSTA